MTRPSLPEASNPAAPGMNKAAPAAVAHAGAASCVVPQEVSSFTT